MLTNVQVAKAKPLERDYSLADGRGLRLLVRANGSKLWQFRYRFKGKARIDSLFTSEICFFACAQRTPAACRPPTLQIAPSADAPARIAGRNNAAQVRSR